MEFWSVSSFYKHLMMCRKFRFTAYPLSNFSGMSPMEFRPFR